MPAIWTEARPAVFRDAYLHWFETLRGRHPATDDGPAGGDIAYEPIFVRLCDPSPAGRQALLTLVSAAGTPVLMDAHERQALEAELTRTGDGLPDEYALYRRLGTPDSDHAALFEVLDTGVPVILRGRGALALAAAPAIAAAETRAAPIVAVMDDGIGFLNARFRRREAGIDRSRFHAVWLQALERSGASPGSVVSGQVLTREAIEARFDQPEDEAYRQINRALHGDRLRGGTDHARSHGTQVLDLAAGADPADRADPIRNWPLLAVQLPPSAIADTSGTVMESYLVQGLRWLLRQARLVNPQAPVLVNISLGFLAGPKDGTRFAEYQLAREAEHWERWTGQPVRLVFAFGNNRRARLVGRMPVPTPAIADATDRPIALRVQPCDGSANFVEIRTPNAQSTALDVAVTTPDGLGSGFVALAPGQERSLKVDGVPVARLYHVAARDFGAGKVSPAHYVLALAPTEASGPAVPCAPIGAWQIALRGVGSDPVTVVLQVQRDDSLYGRPARQSYLDDPSGHQWCHDHADWSGVATEGPMSLAGTHSALCSTGQRQTFAVAAAQRGADGRRLAADYSGEGGSGCAMAGPDVATVVGPGPGRRALTSTGTFSGTARLLGGTSAAAARLTRMLGLSAARIRQNLHRHSTSQVDDLDEQLLELVPVEAAHRARLGLAVVEIRPSGEIDALPMV